MTILNDLKQKINQRKAKLAVIGLGYVGLPVAAMLADAGFDVIGVEIKTDRVEKINASILPMEGHEPGMQELLSKVISGGKLSATPLYDDLADRDVILIDVETPVTFKDLSGGAAPNGGGQRSLNVCDINAVACKSGAIGSHRKHGQPGDLL